MNSSVLKLGVKKLIRDWKSRSVWLISLSLFLAVLNVFSIAFFTEQMDAVISEQASRLLAADRIIRSDHPMRPAIQATLKKLPLRTVETLSFVSMLTLAHDPTQMQLVSVKAVEPSYPLKGTLKISDVHSKQIDSTTHVPIPGVIWLEPRLAQLLDIQSGDQVYIGHETFTVEKLIRAEPGKMSYDLGFAPRAMISMQSVQSTQIVRPGARVSYDLLITAKPTVLKKLDQILPKQLHANERYLKSKTHRVTIKKTLIQMESFLDLIAIANCLMAAMILFSASQLFYNRDRKMVALLKVLGMSTAKIAWLYGTALCLLSSVIFILAIGAGYLLQQGLFIYLENLFGQPFMSGSIQPVLLSAGVFLILFLGTVLPSIVALTKIPAKQLLLEQDHKPSKSLYWGQGICVVGFLFLLYASSSYLLNVLEVLVWLGLLVGLVYLIAYGIIRALKYVKVKNHLIFQLGLNHLTRKVHQGSLRVFILSISIGILLVIVTLSQNLLTRFKAQLPERAPNYFLFNLSKVHQASVRMMLHAQGVNSTFYPVIRGRLIKINEEPVQIDQYDLNSNKRKGMDRALNLTWSQTLPVDNHLVQGRWFDQPDSTQPEISIESDFANRLGIRLGDKLSFQIGAEVVSGFVSSFRTVKWRSFNPNFFVIFSKGILDNFSLTYMSSFYLNKSQKHLANVLIQTHKEALLIDLTLVMAQVQQILDQVALVVKVLWGLTLAFATLLFIAMGFLSLEESVKTHRILKQLGARRAQIRWVYFAEYGVLGLSTGLLGGMLALCLDYYINAFILKFEANVHFELILWSIGMGCFLAPILGYLGHTRSKHIEMV